MTGAHHLRPLAWPALPIAIELHHEPNRPNWLAPPKTAELLELTRPSSTEIGGLLGPSPPPTRFCSPCTAGHTSRSGACSI